MGRYNRATVRAVTVTLLVFFFALPWRVPVLRAQSVADTVTRYLESGEFAPALQVARQADDGVIRDQQLARIALAQAATGARQASMATMRDVQSDLQRRDIARQLAAAPIGAAGGGAIADFDTLINLIQSTVAPDTWSDVGGTGAIEPFPTGVLVDASGVLQRLKPRAVNPLLDSVRERARRDSGNRAVRQQSALRKVSLTRLEKQLQVRHAFGQAPDEAMQNLAGIYRIRYLFVYPETGDLVLAGPAGDWRADSECRPVNVDTGVPVLQLDDLIVMLRNAYDDGGRFGCAISPRQANLAATQEFVQHWRDRPVPPGGRDAWMDQLRQTLGKQDISIWGIDPRTHAARTIVEADYRMKLVGMGLEEGTLGVTSYLDAAKKATAESLRGMSVLRWWFTPNYKAIRTTDNHDVFVLEGNGVRVMSENEMLTATGKRVHTGRSDELSQQFADCFTAHFEQLADKYPIYAELRRLFDMAILASLIRCEGLADQVSWHSAFFRDADACRVRLDRAPCEVDSVANYTVANRTRFIAGVSGGVTVDAGKWVEQQKLTVDDYGRIDAERDAGGPPTLPNDAWWWD